MKNSLSFSCVVVRHHKALAKLKEIKTKIKQNTFQ